MKATLLALAAFILSCSPLLAQDGLRSNNAARYDSLLASRLGADAYGMKNYVMALLKAGPVKIQDSVQRDDLQRRHLKNIMRLAANGTLILAGPFLDDQSLRGIFLFNVETVGEARAIAETDPAVRAGTLVLELHPWYGSAALMEIPGIHKTIEKHSVAE